jgi:hypothetical protein
MGNELVFLPAPFAFRSRFEDTGIDIEDFVSFLRSEWHRLIPNGVHITGRGEHWNAQWARFFLEHPNPTPEEVFRQLRMMLDQLPGKNE